MKRKTFASLSHSRQAGSLGKPLALIFLLGVLFVLAATQARGQELNGMAATTQNADAMEFRRNAAQPRGVAAGEIEWATDSLAGVQLDARLNSR